MPCWWLLICWLRWYCFAATPLPPDAAWCHAITDMPLRRCCWCHFDSFRHIYYAYHFDYDAAFVDAIRDASCLRHFFISPLLLIAAAILRWYFDAYYLFRLLPLPPFSFSSIMLMIRCWCHCHAMLFFSLRWWCCILLLSAAFRLLVAAATLRHYWYAEILRCRWCHYFHIDAAIFITLPSWLAIDYFDLPLPCHAFIISPLFFHFFAIFRFSMLFFATHYAFHWFRYAIDYAFILHYVWLLLIFSLIFCRRLIFRLRHAFAMLFFFIAFLRHIFFHSCRFRRFAFDTLFRCDYYTPCHLDVAIIFIDIAAADAMLSMICCLLRACYCLPCHYAIKILLLTLSLIFSITDYYATPPLLLRWFRLRFFSLSAAADAICWCWLHFHTLIFSPLLILRWCHYARYWYYTRYMLAIRHWLCW